MKNNVNGIDRGLFEESLRFQHLIEERLKRNHEKHNSILKDLWAEV